MWITVLSSCVCALAAGLLLLASEDYATALDDRPRAWGCLAGSFLCMVLGVTVWMI